MADEMRAYATRWFCNSPDDRLLVIAGPSGCGKTHAMRGLWRYARGLNVCAWEAGFWDRPPSVQWTNWPPVARRISENRLTMSEILSDSRSTDLLLLDDIGAESDKYKSGESVDALCQLLNQREHGFTVVTTNIATHKWPERFDLRVADRLCRHSRIVTVDCGSYSLR